MAASYQSSHSKSSKQLQRSGTKTDKSRKGQAQSGALHRASQGSAQTPVLDTSGRMLPFNVSSSLVQAGTTPRGLGTNSRAPQQILLLQESVRLFGCPFSHMNAQQESYVYALMTEPNNNSFL